MQFPSWVDRRSDADRARARLRYMLALAALKKCGQSSLRSIAREVGCDHSSLSLAISKGSFSEQMAEQIEMAFGRDVLPREALINPLDVRSAKA